MFKLTQGKPPFIGVVFNTLEEAKINEDVLEFKSSRFSIMVTGYGSDISFRLQCSEHNIIRHYNNVPFDYNLFKAWRVYSHLQINFGHVIMNGDKPQIVILNNKMFVLPIYYFICG